MLTGALEKLIICGRSSDFRAFFLTLEIFHGTLLIGGGIL
jgi:hypothetical protein